VFSTNCSPFDVDKSYSNFAVYTLLNHNGDFQAAAKELRRQGYGSSRNSSSGPSSSAAPKSELDATGSEPVIVWLDTVDPQPVEWHWRGRIPRGKITLLIGDPGLGKSTLTIDVAARTTQGADWPDADAGQAPQGRVLFLTAEDGLADTVRPRVDLYGGDASRVGVWTAVRTGSDQRPVSLSTDLALLDATLEKYSDVRMIVIDPLSAYLGYKDSYKDAEIRGLVRPLADLADRRRVAVFAVLHMNKAEQFKALYRAQGSIAFVGRREPSLLSAPIQPTKTDGSWSESKSILPRCLRRWRQDRRDGQAHLGP
jgi:hypothetical protein